MKQVSQSEFSCVARRPFDWMAALDDQRPQAAVNKTTAIKSKRLHGCCKKRRTQLFIKRTSTAHSIMFSERTPERKFGARLDW